MQVNEEATSWNEETKMKITFKGPGRPSMVSQELPAKIRMTLHNLQIAGCAISRKKQSLWLELECCNLNLQKYYWKMRALSSWQPNWLVASWSSWNDQSFKGQLQNVKWTQLFMESSNFLERNIMQFWCCSITFQGGVMIWNLEQIPLALVSASKVTTAPTGSHTVRTLYLGFSFF